MHIIYRCSDKGNPKDKPDWIGLFACLRNFLTGVRIDDTFEIWCDNCEDSTVKEVYRILDADCPARFTIRRTALGNSGSFAAVLRELDARDAEDIYLVEDDQWHLPGALDTLRETLAHESARSTTFYTLQDHPDNQDPRVNVAYPQLPYIHFHDVVRFIAGVHWRVTPSTTMTFAGKRWAFQMAADIMEEFCAERIPQDQAMWCELMRRGVRLYNAIPGLATHGERAYLSRGIVWEEKIHHPGNLRDQMRNALMAPEINMTGDESALLDSVAEDGRRNIVVICRDWGIETRAYIAYFLNRVCGGNRGVPMRVVLHFERERPCGRIGRDLDTFLAVLAAEGVTADLRSGVGTQFEACDLIVQAGSAQGARLSRVYAQNLTSAGGWLVFGVTRQWGQNWCENVEDVEKDGAALNLMPEDIVADVNVFKDVQERLPGWGIDTRVANGGLGVAYSVVK